MGLLVLLSWELGEFAERGRRTRAMVVSVVLLALAGCVAVTHLQLRHWQSSLTLFQHALDVTANNRVAHNNLGIALAEAQCGDEAIAHYREALRLASNYDDARINLGLALTGRGELDEAQREFSTVLEQRPNAQAHVALGNVFERRRQMEEAVREYRAALALRPADAYAHFNLANVLSGKNEFAEALVHYVAALQAKPDWAVARFKLGVALTRLGKAKEALAQFEAAAQLDPSLAEAHLHAGLALVAEGRTQPALEHLRRAVALKPDGVEGLDRFAWLLATHPDAQFRDGKEAVRLATHAAEVTKSSDAATLSILAAAFAEAGRFPEAISTAKQARELALASGQKEFGERIQSHLQQYESGQPCRK